LQQIKKRNQKTLINNGVGKEITHGTNDNVSYWWSCCWWY